MIAAAEFGIQQGAGALIIVIAITGLLIYVFSGRRR